MHNNVRDLSLPLLSKAATKLREINLHTTDKNGSNITYRAKAEQFKKNIQGYCDHNTIIHDLIVLIISKMLIILNTRYNLIAYQQ